MRRLPDKPSLDHLRKQAKDLLAEARGSEPKATLAGAQASLARQYGFQSWTDLKTEVEVRRTNVRASKPEFASALAASFGLGDVTGAMLPIDRGAMARSWSLETDSGRWMAIELFDWVRPDSVVAGVRLLEAAAGAGVQVPKPVRSTDDAIIEAVACGSWRVYEWMDLGPAPTNPVGRAAASAMGGVLATLHGLAIPAPGPVSPWLTYQRSEADWRQLLTRAVSAGVSWASVLEAAIPVFLDLARIDDEQDPQSAAILCHCDLRPGGVRIGRAGTLVILDWENAGALPPRWELGTVLTQWALGPGEQLDEAAARALTDAYTAEAGLIAPLDLSIFRSSISAYLNWTAGRVARALTDDDAGERERALRELPSLLAHPRSRGQLEHILHAIGR